MALTPAKELFRWKLRKCGKHVINLCMHMFLFSGVLVGLMTGAAQAVRANPEGGVVVGGSATITQTPAELQINQSSDRALIEWSSFNINAGETTRFIQPGASAIALNRVVNSSQLSAINGNLIANGRIIVINPNGVLIGASGNVDTAGFIATTADIDNDAFMNSAGALNFDRAGRTDASVRNQGTISVGEAGLAALVAPTVRNDGVIQGNLAKVQLAAGDTFAVDFYGDGLLSLAVSAPQDGSGRTISVENTGSVYADGGKVLMTAAAASDVVDSVINSSGYVQARGLQNRNGEIVLTGAGADVKVSGKIDASGSNDGGSVKIGGDYQGQGTLAHADTVTIDDTAEIFADAGENGNGGTIVVWSDKATTTRGRFYARGGSQSGNGGLVETSSEGILDVDGSSVNTLAAAGDAGYWLLDPDDINVVGSGVSYVGLPAGGTSNVDVNTINAALSNVVLAAANSITFSTNVNIAAAGVDLTAVAGVSGSDIGAVINGTAYNLAAGTGGIDILLSGGYIRTNGGDVNLLSGSTIKVNNSKIYTSGGNVMMKSGAITINNNAAIGTVGGNVTLTAVAAGSGGSKTTGDVSTNSVSINTTSATAPSIGGIHLTQDGVAKTYFDLFNPANSTQSQTLSGGSITIIAKKISGNSTCFAAGGPGCGVTDPLAINLIVTILNSGKVYGDTDPLYLTSGYVGNTYWNITSGSLNTGDTLTVDLARTSAENVGTYGSNIYQTGYVLSNASNYAVTFVNGSFTITPAPLTITANSGVKTYGDTYNFTGTEFTTSGLKFSDDVSSLTLSSLGAAATAGGSAVYSITGSNAVGTGLGNYNITYAPGTLTVNPAILTITANSFGKTYGDTYTFLGSEFTSSGLKNSDSVTGVTLISAGAAPTAAVNSYDIIASNAVGSNLLGNYTINYNPGTLTVNPAALTITANDQTKAYDGSAYSGGNGVSYVGFVGGDDETDLMTAAHIAAATA
ncbi:MAG: filamentous hemagglutinin N-terminal domain-containing protein [Micavibrio aeruginosavorus]|nr:filamentous hemagglutinin N-terminal domain-containing protein [Micavibrio aeruginosavorus]